MKHSNFLSALKTAFIGIRSLFKESRNARIQGVLFLCVSITGLYVQLTSYDWLWVLAASALVLTMEALNTSIEQLADLISSEYHPKIKILKDIAAGAVLIASIFSIIVACVVFLPYLSAIFPG
jgi:diacylglycerol kinase